ncbi:MAG: hypothetical protein WD046_05905 [Paracoccaceae bacterium]
MTYLKKMKTCFAASALLWPLPLAAQTPETGIASLQALSVEALRDRDYGGALDVAARIDCPGRANGAEGIILGHESDGLDLYARLQLPDGAAPESGYPVVMFLHGWVGAENAPGYLFSCNADGYYRDIINAYADAGYAVLMPGFRGHGTFNDTPAEGIEWVQAWDNGSYLSPVFYAIDALNLLAVVPQIGDLGLVVAGAPVTVNPDIVHVIGHSQGGDAAAMLLAAVGEGAGNGLAVTSGSLWSSTYVDRFTQLDTYHAMESTTAAFYSGDGTWNGTAIGADGSVNPDFVFGYPPSWIGTMNPDDWSWQADYWARSASVRAAVETQLSQMYGAINGGVADMSSLTWSISADKDGGFTVNHDPALIGPMAAIGAHDAAQYMREPLHLHFSDRDFYSFPEWNTAFCARVNAAGGACTAYEYPGTTHKLGVADAEWYSPEGTEDGFAVMIERDLALFGG